MKKGYYISTRGITSVFSTIQVFNWPPPINEIDNIRWDDTIHNDGEYLVAIFRIKWK